MSAIDRIIKDRMFIAMAIINIKQICDENEIEDCEQ